LIERFPHVQHEILKSNLGFTGGANAGLRAVFARGEWAAFMSNDCELKSLPTEPARPGLFGPWIWGRKGVHIDAVGGFFDTRKGRLHHCRSKTEFLQIPAGAHRYIPGAAFLLDRKSFHVLGGFDESLHTYWEDVDLSLRADALNITLGICDSFEVRHYGGKTCYKDRKYTTFYFQRNRQRLARQYCPARHRTALEMRLLWDRLRTASRLLRHQKFEDLRHLLY
jgi:GT2 family glycosyltransferase